MGSLVGASEEIRNKNGSDSSLLEYTVNTLFALPLMLSSITFR